MLICPQLLVYLQLMYCALYCHQACLPLLLQNDAKLLRPHLKEEEISLVLETCCPYINQPGHLELDIITQDNTEKLKANNQQVTVTEKSDVNPTMPEENPLLKQRMRSDRQNPEMCKVIHLLCSTPPVRSMVKELGKKVCGHWPNSFIYQHCTRCW